ncbi:MAG: phage protease [Deltaproteobacteria bacterium]
MNLPNLNTHLALNFEISKDGTLPESIELLPAGSVVVGRDGRSWINDNPSALCMAFITDRKELPIDWEHSSELKAINGEEAPAAGWIKELKIREDGAVIGQVEWTPRGANSVANREYRYVSPVFKFDPKTKRILQLTSCGLTNQPNLFLSALNQAQISEKPTEVTPMIEKLLTLLGLPATATEQEVLDCIASLKNKKPDCDGDGAMNRQAPSIDKFVPRVDYDLALNRATTAETKIKDIESKAIETAINTEIESALKAGKITPATVDHHKNACIRAGGVEEFKAFCQVAPTIADNSNLSNRKPDNDNKALNTEEIYICKALGISETDFIKQKEKGV